LRRISFHSKVSPDKMQAWFAFSLGPGSGPG
jgi:hypothetical protein